MKGNEDTVCENMTKIRQYNENFKYISYTSYIYAAKPDTMYFYVSVTAAKK